MISYNDLIQISFLHTNKMYDELLQYVQNKINEKGLIKFLNKVKSLKYITETDSINLNYKDRELIIYKENFLKNLPTDSISTHIVDGHNVTIGYPDMDNYNTGSFLKEIDGEKITEKDYKHIPLSFIRKIKKHTSPFIRTRNNLTWDSSVIGTYQQYSKLKNYIFQETNLENLYLHTLITNERARKSFKKAGFSEIGEVRKDGMNFIKMNYKKA